MLLKHKNYLLEFEVLTGSTTDTSTSFKNLTVEKEDLFLVMDGILTDLNIEQVFEKIYTVKVLPFPEGYMLKINGFSILEHFELKNNFLQSVNNVKISLFDKKSGLNLFFKHIKNAIFMYNDIKLSEREASDYQTLMKKAYSKVKEEIKEETAVTEPVEVTLNDHSVTEPVEMTESIENTEPIEETITEETAVEETAVKKTAVVEPVEMTELIDTSTLLNNQEVVDPIKTKKSLFTDEDFENEEIIEQLEENEIISESNEDQIMNLGEIDLPNLVTEPVDASTPLSDPPVIEPVKMKLKFIEDIEL